MDNKAKLSTLIYEHPDFPLRIVIDDVDPTIYHLDLERYLIIDDVHIDKGLLIDDYYFIKSFDYSEFVSYSIGNTALGDPIPTDDEMTENYEALPWEDVIYVHVSRNKIGG